MDYDVLIIGGGPGGSSAATFLAQAGKKVLLLEKERFPRFHVGESLLPYNHRIFKEMGVLSKLEAEDFPRKFGAQFHLGNGSKKLELVFRNGCFTREPMAFQVERSRFDHLLLQHATSVGAEVREGWTVERYQEDDHGAQVTATDPSGGSHTLSARYLIDASGRQNLTGNQDQLRVIHPDLKKMSIFGHFKQVKLSPDEKGGDTVIVRLENKWFWVIPISSEKTSVGCVLDRDELAQCGMKPDLLFESIWKSSPVMRDRMENAERVGPIHTTSDFSYYNRRLVGRRLLRVGDAAGFMDPIFSAGVYLAMYSGRLAAKTIEACDRQPGSRTKFFETFEKKVSHGMHFYWELVENYYTTPFMEVFLEPKARFDLPAAVTAVLAGELEGGWAVRWRLRLFFQIVKLQRRFPLVPRISFS